MKKLKTLWELFWVFLKIGTFTFGGGLAMLPLIQKEVVDIRKWVEEDEILDVFAISQSLPGVIAINAATFIGNKVAGKWGSAAATLGVNLPAFLSIILVIEVLNGLKGNIYIEKVLGGIRAASAALILLAAIKLGKSAVKGKTGIIIALISFTSIIIFNISAVWSIILGGVTGYMMYLLGRRDNK